ncbi:MAG: hypothetical protein C0608_00175 [Deltaproteobacteria bacterium]|nr:MAG: hypothetical protein C0608_00175 [Deltaproteobacteria bacterium]
MIEKYCDAKWEEELLQAAWTGESSVEIVEHLAGCEKCRAFLKAEQRLSDVARDAAFSVKPGVKRGLREGIFSRTTRRPSFTHRWQVWGKALVAATGMVAVLFVIRMNTNVQTPKPTVPVGIDMELLQNMDVIENMELLEMLDALEELSDG